MEKQTVTNLKKDFDAVLLSLRSLRDEIKVQAHLATMDLKEEWEKMQPRIDEAEQAAHSLTEAAVNAGHDLQRRMIDLKAKLMQSHREHQPRR